MSDKIELDPKPEYVYVTIPAEYVCVYHRILALMADYGEEMLKDCKASCTDKNSSVIECYNMFNAAIAARTMGKGKLAETIIYYIKSKINQIYKGNQDTPGYVFPVDKEGRIKAFVSCNDRPKFFINSKDGVLYKKDMGLGVREYYSLDSNDKPWEGKGHIPVVPPIESPFDVLIDAFISQDGKLHIKTTYYLNGEELDETVNEDWYFDAKAFANTSDITDISYGKHLITLVAQYDEYLITKQVIVYHKLNED